LLGFRTFYSSSAVSRNTETNFQQVAVLNSPIQLLSTTKCPKCAYYGCGPQICSYSFYYLCFSLIFPFLLTIVFCYLFSTPPGVGRKQKLLRTLRPDQPGCSRKARNLLFNKTRRFCLKVIFTRPRLRLSGTIAREASSHHNLRWSIQIRST
jgi:hypothetical protein